MDVLTFESLPQAVTTLLNEVKELKSLLTGYSTPKVIEEQEQLLSVKEAADFLNLSVPTIYSKVNRAELPSMKQGNRLYFSNKELTEYIKAGRKKTYTEVGAAADDYFSNSKKLK